jgi:hypothetical protein
MGWKRRIQERRVLFHVTGWVRRVRWRGCQAPNGGSDVDENPKRDQPLFHYVTRDAGACVLFKPNTHGGTESRTTFCFTEATLLNISCTVIVCSFSGTKGRSEEVQNKEDRKKAKIRFLDKLEQTDQVSICRAETGLAHPRGSPILRTPRTRPSCPTLQRRKQRQPV